MEKEIKFMCVRIISFSILFFLVDYIFKFQDEYHWFGKILAYTIIGFIIFGVIPFCIRKWKKTKIWKGFADKWQLDKKLPNR